MIKKIGTDDELLNCDAVDMVARRKINEIIDYVNKVTEKEKEELKPCPFCGSPVTLEEREETKEMYYDICCSNAGCYLEFGADWNIEKKPLIKMWNNRMGGE